MTYQQSLKLCHELLNFVSPYKCEMIIFDFSSQTDFSIILLEKEDWNLFRNLATEKDSKGLPITLISEGMLSYYNLIGDYHFDLCSGAFVDFYSRENLKQRTPSVIRLEMAGLVSALKSGVPTTESEDGISH
jgi:hypothetical protein